MVRKVCRILFFRPVFLFFLLLGLTAFLATLGYFYSQDGTYLALKILSFGLVGAIAGLVGVLDLSGCRGRHSLSDDEYRLKRKRFNINLLRIGTAYLFILVCLCSSSRIYEIPDKSVNMGSYYCGNYYVTNPASKIKYFGEVSRGGSKLGIICGDSCNIRDLYLYWLGNSVRWRSISFFERDLNLTRQISLNGESGTVRLRVRLMSQDQSAQDEIGKLIFSGGKEPSYYSLSDIADKVLGEEAGKDPFSASRLRERLVEALTPFYRAEDTKISVEAGHDIIEFDR